MIREYIFNCEKCKNEYRLFLSDINFKNRNYRKHCTLSCANSRQHTAETKLKIGNSQPNKGNTSFEYRPCKNCNILFKVETYKKKKFCSKFCAHSFQAKERGLGGYNKNSIKRHKKGMYKGYWCDSSWELAYVIYNLEHNIKFERNTEKFAYDYNGKIKNFIPDFILDSGIYVEVKGYVGPEAKAKIKDFKNRIKLIDVNKIKKYIDYCNIKYGENFTHLYKK